MHLNVFKDLKTLGRSLAEWIVADILRTLKQKDRYNLVLSGGNTPKGLYKILSEAPFKDKVQWEKIHFFMGDERYVPFEDDRNNGKMAYETLLNHVPVPKSNVHLMDTSLSPEASAGAYEKMLQAYFKDAHTTFDLVLLGMGDDGHTLSLFPGTEVIQEEQKWVAAPFVKAQDMYRITLTKSIVNRAESIVFLATGAKKATVLKKVLEGAYEPDKYPSQVIKPENGELYWYVDEAAASELQKRNGS